jgi:hypothetical protein
MAESAREAWLAYTHHYPRGLGHMEKIAEKARRHQDHRAAKLIESELDALRERRRRTLVARNERKRETRKSAKRPRCCVVCGGVIAPSARADRKTCGAACRKALSRRHT